MCERRGFACENPGFVVFFYFAVSPCWQVNQSVLCGLRLVCFTVRCPSVGKSLNSDVIIRRITNVNKPHVVCALRKPS